MSSSNQFKPKSFLTERGSLIWVGRNARENSYLSFTFAQPTDLFFHVADFPGSHVLLRADSPTISDITEAAMLAVHFSKAKKKIVKVDYTEAENLRKPKGGPAGLVELKKFKTIKITRNLAEVEKVLKRKRED